MEPYRISEQSCALPSACSSTPVNMLSYPDKSCYRTIYSGAQAQLSLQADEIGKQSIWHLSQQFNELRLEWREAHSKSPERLTMATFLAALEAAFTHFPHQTKIFVSVPKQLIAESYDSGVLVKTSDGSFIVHAELFWQQARVWHTGTRLQAYPLYLVISHGRRHPLRPPKPAGTVYRRFIAWLGRTLSFRTVDIDSDLVRFNRWMNDPVVAAFWQETGDLAQHRAYLEGIQADPHVISLISCLDDEPFGYFEIYWAKENRIAPYYDVDDFDRGWHVLIGESHFRGKPFVTAWLPSISHYLFLDDDRTQRIVIEPRSDNSKMLRNLAQCGYAHLKEFDFPHKRAMLGMLLRERFFAERLWVPRNTLSPHSVSLS
ncbi:Protein N-acetyltransferase, RimJ/RimL family [Nitrosomonas nitrosa]|uniref:Protein N-acetyltransferase, RimJ/RimL family n=1 Tax=Nitrosomonas nitrosa TaxID=52442 RepID=A0A1I4RBC2_9PROT|nr:GNAT family N-acetyltransferase [Nitrosomonas nitrosa]SFM49260.1 Protein N-acetyltransferase, RimJ/RimL family [Nitrosomonas nitrosa]